MATCCFGALVNGIIASKVNKERQSNAQYDIVLAHSKSSTQVFKKQFKLKANILFGKHPQANARACFRSNSCSQIKI